MNRAAQQKWDVAFKWFGLVTVIVSGLWTYVVYRDNRQADLRHESDTQKSAEVARKKELDAFIFQHQATLYFDSARAAATMASALDPDAPDRTWISSKSLHEARERFEQLYWGEMVVVEDRRVELSMIAFRNCLLQKGKDCEREGVDQYNQPIDRETLGKVSEPDLYNLSLEIGACTRSALQKGREIQFGLTNPAITTCPYDGKEPSKTPSQGTAAKGQ